MRRDVAKVSVTTREIKLYSLIQVEKSYSLGSDCRTAVDHASGDPQVAGFISFSFHTTGNESLNRSLVESQNTKNDSIAF